MKEILQKRIAQKQSHIKIDIKKAIQHGNQGNIEGFLKFAMQVKQMNDEIKILSLIIS